jgi:capsular exopolysaccharide synthesis family protein
LLFLLDSVDRRVKTVEEFEREYRLPALTVVTQSAFRSRLAKDRGDELEPYRILRSALDFAAISRQLDSLMVTSAVSGEGKTTVAVDLSHAMAFTGRPVVLIELDLRRPSFASHFALDGSTGLTTALTRNAPLSELLIEPFPELPNFSVLPAGLLPHNPSELLGSDRVAELISDLRRDDGIMIVDAPPLNPVADAQVLLSNPAISAVLVVARLEKTTRDETRRARAILDHHRIEPVGLAVTGLHDAARYGYEAYARNDAENAGNAETLAYSGGSSVGQQSS